MSVFVAGHRGMVGSAICRLLEKNGQSYVTRDRKQLDLLNQAEVSSFMRDVKPSAVILAAAKVGGIHANNAYPADFIYENLVIQTNVIHQAFSQGITKLLFLGSSCIYPKHTSQPMTESALLTGQLEPTNEPYAIAKIAGIKLCESYNRQHSVDYRSVMPTNLYGPGDNFHPENSHVLPALLRRFHEAKINNLEEVKIWGTGSPKREFLHVDDMAAASLHVMNLPQLEYQNYTSLHESHINVGTGTDVSILDLAKQIAETVGYKGKITTDPSKPDGTPRKLLDVSRLKTLGWSHKISLKDGIEDTYDWFLNNQDTYRT